MGIQSNSPALCRLQEWFCPLFSSPLVLHCSYVLHMHRAVLTTGCSARAFPVLLAEMACGQPKELKGESAAQSSSLLHGTAS